MIGPFGSYILDPAQKAAAVEDFKRRKKRHRELNHSRWVAGERRKKRLRRHRGKIALASRMRNRR